MIEENWLRLVGRYEGLELDAFVVMPNHLHGLVILPDEKAIPLPQIIGAFKSITTVEYGRGVREHRWEPFDVRLWHRNYYDHVARNEADLDRIRQYIFDNPLKREVDRLSREHSG